MHAMTDFSKEKHSASVRLPLDLYERFIRLKTEQAHEGVPDSKLLIEAVRLYVERAEQFGIDRNFKVKEASEAPPTTARRPQRA